MVYVFVTKTVEPAALVEVEMTTFVSVVRLAKEFVVEVPETGAKLEVDT